MLRENSFSQTITTNVQLIKKKCFTCNKRRTQHKNTEKESEKRISNERMFLRKEFKSQQQCRAHTHIHTPTPCKSGLGRKKSSSTGGNSYKRIHHFACTFTFIFILHVLGRHLAHEESLLLLPLKRQKFPKNTRFCVQQVKDDTRAKWSSIIWRSRGAAAS